MHKMRRKEKNPFSTVSTNDFELKRNGSAFHNLHLNEISTNNYKDYNWLLIMNVSKPVHGNSMYLVEEKLFLSDLLRMSSLLNSLLHVMFSFCSRNIYR